MISISINNRFIQIHWKFRTKIKMLPFSKKKKKKKSKCYISKSPFITINYLVLGEIRDFFIFIICLFFKKEFLVVKNLVFQLVRTF